MPHPEVEEYLANMYDEFGQPRRSKRQKYCEDHGLRLDDGFCDACYVERCSDQ